MIRILSKYIPSVFGKRKTKSDEKITIIIDQLCNRFFCLSNNIEEKGQVMKK